jgi:hypothetical protein
MLGQFIEWNLTQYLQNQNISSHHVHRTPSVMIPLPNKTSLSLLLTIKMKHEDNSTNEYSVLDPTNIQDIFGPEQQLKS